MLSFYRPFCALKQQRSIFISSSNMIKRVFGSKRQYEELKAPIELLDTGKLSNSEISSPGGETNVEYDASCIITEEIHGRKKLYKNLKNDKFQFEWERQGGFFYRLPLVTFGIAWLRGTTSFDFQPCSCL
jgi:hypothetical protein